MQGPVILVDNVLDGMSVLSSTKPCGSSTGRHCKAEWKRWGGEITSKLADEGLKKASWRDHLERMENLLKAKLTSSPSNLEHASTNALLKEVISLTETNMLQPLLCGCPATFAALCDMAYDSTPFAPQGVIRGYSQIALFSDSWCCVYPDGRGASQGTALSLPAAAGQFGMRNPSELRHNGAAHGATFATIIENAHRWIDQNIRAETPEHGLEGPSVTRLPEQVHVIVVSGMNELTKAALKKMTTSSTAQPRQFSSIPNTTALVEMDYELEGGKVDDEDFEPPDCQVDLTEELRTACVRALELQMKCSRLTIVIGGRAKDWGLSRAYDDVVREVKRHLIATPRLVHCSSLAKFFNVQCFAPISE